MESRHAIHAGLPCLFSAFLVAVSLSAAQPAAFHDGIDRTDPNFVTASLLVMSPGNGFCSCEECIAVRKEWT